METESNIILVIYGDRPYEEIKVDHYSISLHGERGEPNTLHLYPDEDVAKTKELIKALAKGAGLAVAIFELKGDQQTIL